MASMVAAAQTMISIDFPDGSIVSYDRIRRDMILTLSNGGIMSTGASIPARPNAPVVVVAEDGTEQVVEEEVPVAVSRSAFVQKLGFKKAPVIGTDIWNKRFIHLDASTLSYHENERSSPKGVIHLVPGCEVDIIHARDPANKDRQEGGHNPGMANLMTMQIGKLMDSRSGPIGKNNCLELHVPAEVGNMVGSVLNSSFMSLAASGASGVKSNQARTFYFSFDSLDEATDFALAIKNNIDVLVKDKEMESKQKGGLMGHISGAMNMMNAMKQNLELMKSPDTSLEWYKISLQSSLPSDVMYERLMIFYDTLASLNVRPTY